MNLSMTGVSFMISVFSEIWANVNRKSLLTADPLRIETANERERTPGQGNQRARVIRVYSRQVAVHPPQNSSVVVSL
jgi:hypothetical protein